MTGAGPTFIRTDRKGGKGGGIVEVVVGLSSSFDFLWLFMMFVLNGL